MKIINYVKANYPMIVVRTFEPNRFIEELAFFNETKPFKSKENGDYKRNIVTWDIQAGFNKVEVEETGDGTPFVVKKEVKLSGGGEEFGPPPSPEEKALDAINTAVNWKDGLTIFCFKNFPWFLQNLEIIQALQNAPPLLKHKDRKITFLFLTTPGWTNLPEELARDIQLEDFDLPDREQLKGVFDKFHEKPKSDGHLEQLLDAMIGMDLISAEDSLAKSLVETKGEFNVNLILNMKAQLVKKAAGLHFSNYKETFTSLIGLDEAKTWHINRFQRRRILKEKGLPLNLPLKGVIFTGLPGNGKSHFGKALANEVGWPCLTLNIHELLDKFVGESPRKFREALKVARIMGPCVVLIEEIDKGLGGVGGSDGTNVYQELGSILLQEMDIVDLERPIFFICTSNNLGKIPTEYLRLGRWDAIFFVDNPTPKNARKILDMYCKEFWQDISGIKVSELKDYSGAELRQVAIEAAYRDNLEEALDFVTPIATVRMEQYSEIRRRAKEVGAVPAEKGLSFYAATTLKDSLDYADFVRSVSY